MTQTEAQFHTLANAMDFIRLEGEDMDNSFVRNYFMDLVLAAIPGVKETPLRTKELRVLLEVAKS